MKSKTIKFNVFAFLTFLILTTGMYLGQFEVGSNIYIIMLILNIVLSQAITFFLPSGQFVGAGQNWSLGKWIARMGSVTLATFAALSGHGIATAIIASVQPLIEIIIRVYGSETQGQQEAFKNKIS